VLLTALRRKHKERRTERKRGTAMELKEGDGTGRVETGGGKVE
jgi:hypothetical protein